MEYAKLCMSMQLGNARYSAESDVRCRRSAHRQLAVAVRSSALWNRSAEVIVVGWVAATHHTTRASF
jgi:hypothetical protein